MLRKCTIFAGLLAASLLAAATCAARTGMESPQLPKVFADLISGPTAGTVTHTGAMFEYELSVGTSRPGGIPGFTARASLPGMKIIKLDRVQLDSNVKVTMKQMSPHGAVWSFGRLPGNSGYSFRFLAQATGPVGKWLSDTMVVTLPGGKSATYALNTYKLSR